MIYTIGLIDKYEAMIDGGTAIKAGRRADYEGGWVWPTAAAAQAYLAERKSEHDRRVYAVLADWDIDTMPVAGEPYHVLLRDAVVLRAG